MYVCTICTGEKEEEGGAATAAVRNNVSSGRNCLRYISAPPRWTIKQDDRVFVPPPPPFPRCIEERSISMAGRNIRSISGSVERIFSGYGVFLVAARERLSLSSPSPSLSSSLALLRSFFFADLRGSRAIDTPVRSRLIDSWKCPCHV